MASIANQFLVKLENLPIEAQFYFDSEFLASKIGTLGEQYGLSSKYIHELIYGVVVEDFSLAVPENQPAIATFADENAKRAFINDFWGKIVLPVADYVGIEGLGGALKSKIGDWQRYAADINEFVEELKDERARVMEELANVKAETTDADDEAAVAISLFSDGLLHILRNNDNQTVFDLNGGLVYLLNYDPELKGRLADLIIDSQERISERNISLGEKLVPPTISNWLKDFMQKQGSGNFNNLAISQYLTSSENAKNLGSDEKKLIGNAFQLYRNIKFYPESMKDIAPEQWFIVPVDPLFLESLRRNASEDKPIDRAVDMSKSPEVLPVKEDAVASVPKAPAALGVKEARTAELQAMAGTFPIDSLERRAIEQEIARLNK
jgi:hypothetical protein